MSESHLQGFIVVVLILMWSSSALATQSVGWDVAISASAQGAAMTLTVDILFDDDKTNSEFGQPCMSRDDVWLEIDDTTTGDDGNDNANWTPAFIISQWEEFPYGVGNHDAAESGEGGPNAWDYEFRESAAQSELVQNCLGAQEFP